MSELEEILGPKLYESMSKINDFIMGMREEYWKNEAEAIFVVTVPKGDNENCFGNIASCFGESDEPRTYIMAKAVMALVMTLLELGIKQEVIMMTVLAAFEKHAGEEVTAVEEIPGLGEFKDA